MAGNTSETAIVPFKSNYKDESSRFKMVLIGETGSGKTGFVGLIKNYESMRCNTQPSMIVATPTANTGAMVSDTTTSIPYNVDIDEFKLTVIDTPGLADTRGDEKSKDNIKDIIAKIKEDNYIHCVCLVINGTQCRLTSLMSDVIYAITTILPKEVLNNVVVVFTNTSDKLSQNFDVNILYSEFELSIKQDHIFTFENPYSRWLNAKRLSIEYSQEKAKSEIGIAFKELEKMLTKIQGLKPVITLSFGEFRELIDQIEKDIVLISTTQENIRSVKNMVKEIKDHINTKETLQQALSKKFTFKEIKVQVTTDRNMVCNVPNCYSNCHESCRCWFTGAIFHRTSMCQTFANTPTCRKCKHHYNEHSKHNFLFITEEIEVQPWKKGDVDNLEKVIRQKETTLNEQSETIAKYDKEVEDISKRLIEELVKFQTMGSNFFFSKVAIEEIKKLKKQIDLLSEFSVKDDVKKMLDDTYMIAKNPYSDDKKLQKAKIRWACGLLGLDPENVTEEEISKAFREHSKSSHPDMCKSEEGLPIFKLYNHAKDYLHSLHFPRVHIPSFRSRTL